MVVSHIFKPEMVSTYGWFPHMDSLHTWMVSTYGWHPQVVVQIVPMSAGSSTTSITHNIDNTNLNGVHNHTSNFNNQIFVKDFTLINDQV